MRRARSGSLAFTALLSGALMLSGCGQPPGTDGNLVDGWPMPATPTPYTPAAQGCFRAHLIVGGPAAKLPAVIDCALPHNLETVSVGTFTDADAARGSVPPTGGPEQRRAYAQCVSAAKEFLGEDWHNGSLLLLVTVPTDVQWSGGGRWFRCDLIEVDVDGNQVNRQGTLRGGLTGDRPVGLACITATGSEDDLEFDKNVPCTESHVAEYTGYFDAPETTYPTGSDADLMAERGCAPVIAQYIAVPNNSDLFYRIGFIYELPDEDHWQLGDRGVRCYVWTEKPASNSLRGAGPGALPVG